MPKISVIIPVFNAQKYLLESIGSVLNQTLKEIEIIVINDGSTDQTLEILESISIKDSRLIILNQKNSGQAIASNKALEIAKGEYIKYFDADDLMNETHLESMYLKIVNKGDVLVSCKWARFYNDEIINARFIPCSTWKNLNSVDWLTNAMSEKYDMMPLWLWLIPKKLLLNLGGWDERLTLNNDFEFSIRILTNARFVYFEEDAIIFYRSGHSNTLSSIKSEKLYEQAFLSAKLGCNQLLKISKDSKMKLLCANKYAYWLQEIYPKYPILRKKIEFEIKNLGGANRVFQDSKFMLYLQKIIGWKWAKRLKMFFYNLGYAKLLSINKIYDK